MAPSTSGYESDVSAEQINISDGDVVAVNANETVAAANGFVVVVDQESHTSAHEEDLTDASEEQQDPSLVPLPSSDIDSSPTLAGSESSRSQQHLALFNLALREGKSVEELIEDDMDLVRNMPDAFKGAASFRVLDKLYEHLDSADFSFECGRWRMKIHSAVVEANCPPIAKLLDDARAEGRKPRALKLKEALHDPEKQDPPDSFEPYYIQEFVHYLYHFEFSLGFDYMNEAHRLLRVAQMHDTATKFEAMMAMKSMALVFESLLPTFDENRVQHGGPTIPDIGGIFKWIFKEHTKEKAHHLRLKTVIARYLDDQFHFFKRDRTFGAMLEQCPEMGLELVRYRLAKIEEKNSTKYQLEARSFEKSD